MNTFGNAVYIILIIVGITFGLLTVVGVEDNVDATRVLTQTGYTNITIVGRIAFVCAKGELWHTEFNARANGGQMVHGVVCSGILKGSTVRIL